MKCQTIHPEEDRYDFSQADEFVKFGEDNGMYIIGHCLVWHSQLAPWFCVDKDGNKYIKGDMVQYSYVGKTVMAYRDYVDANGNVIKTETLHKDTYQSRNTTYKCTPYVEPEVPEEPDPIDPDYPDNPDDPTEPDDPINPWD